MKRRKSDKISNIGCIRLFVIALVVYGFASDLYEQIVAEGWGTDAGRVVILVVFGVLLIGFISLIRKASGGETQNLSLKNYQNLPRLEAPAGYVYVIQDVSHSKQYKIGRTNHPSRRLNRFDVVLPIETSLIALLESSDAAALEKRLHLRYGKQHTRGEWFNLTPDQLKAIRSL